MSAKETLILHRKEKSAPSGNDHAQKNTSLRAEAASPSQILSQDRSIEKIDSRQEREVQRVILEANLADYEISSSSESDISKDDEDELSFNFNDFLETFSGVPSLEVLSIASGTKKGIRTTDGKDQEESLQKDVGVFVDPLTGEVIAEKVPVEVIEEEVEEEELEESIETEPLSAIIFSLSEDTGLAALLETPAEEFEVKAEEAEALDDFLMHDVVVEQIPSRDLSKEALEQERLRLLLIEETENFLNKLINQAVAKSEYKHPDTILRESLDKFLLMEELCKKLEELEIERKVQFHLNRKVIDYYKRKKSFQRITEEPEELEMKHAAKLKEVTKKLDQMLVVENRLTEKFEEIAKELRAKKIALLQQNIDKEKEFEALVRASLIKSNNGRLAVIIPPLIEEINNFRKHVSDKRLQLIQFQHTAAVLQKKIDDFENKFRVREYMALQTETTELDKKIEERNADLENSRSRCNTNIHAFSHTREKIDSLRLFNQMNKKALFELQSQKKLVRERLVHLKVERTRYQKEKRELTFQTGLLSKPSLLRDYDNTVEQLNDINKRVESLRKQRVELLEKLKKLEKIYSAGDRIKIK
ncbi:cilia- and flagella-associated protein 184-like [Eurosta solidaginis]|uniref:cilia- and flagella-associated protein 184-like n=1 Tax=Eurosta solidaginis TaxID=178769 RepID=UPI003531147D